MTPIRIATSFALAGAVAVSAPAFAATSSTVTFNANSTSLPAYTTASVIQSFTGSTEPTFGNAVPAPISGYNQTIVSGINGTARGTSRILTPSQAQINAGTPLSGQYLAIRSTPTATKNSTISYTLSIQQGVTKPIQFLAFVIGSYVSASSVVLNYQDGTNSGNILAGLSGLNPGSSGTVIVDRGGLSGIVSAVFSVSSPAGGTTNTFNIDSIAAAAPEPATWGMMLLGFGLAGAQLRRRRKAAPALA